jgi:hypothetical protein
MRPLIVFVASLLFLFYDSLAEPATLALAGASLWLVGATLRTGLASPLLKFRLVRPRHPLPLARRSG